MFQMERPGLSLEDVVEAPQGGQYLVGLDVFGDQYDPRVVLFVGPLFEVLGGMNDVLNSV